MLNPSRPFSYLASFIALALIPLSAAAQQPKNTVSYSLSGDCSSDNQPIPDAKIDIYLLTHGESDQPPKLLKSTTTNDEGKFELQVQLDEERKLDARDSHLTVVATKPGRASVIQGYLTEDQLKALNLRMPPAASITGRVVDEEGQPIPAAEVYTRDLGYGEPLPGVCHAKTNEEGKFEISDSFPWTPQPLVEVADGVFEGNSTSYLSVRSEGFAAARPGYKAVPVDLGDITLEREAVIEGRVVEGDQPVAGIKVELQNTREHPGSGGAYESTVTDEDGRYRLTGLVAGPFNVWATTPDDKACIALDSFRAEKGETAKAPDIKIVSGTWIEGKIVNQFGEPLAKRIGGDPLQVGLHGPSRPKSGAAVQSVVVKPDGTFRMCVPPGKNFPYIMTRQGQKAKIRDEKGTDYNDGWVPIKDGETKKLIYTSTIDEERPGGDF